MLIDWIIFIFLLWYVYMLFIEDIIIIKKLSEDKEGIFIPIEIRDNTLLLNELVNKFSYPNLRGIRYGANGNCTIEGKYASHSLEIRDDRIFIIRDFDTLRKGTRNKVRALREADIIKIYLEKHFNPNSEIDAYKEYKRFNAKSLEKSFVYMTSTIALITLVFFGAMKINQDNKINSIRNAYLEKYSKDKTIGSAFNSFFDDNQWYIDGDYVCFTGNRSYEEFFIEVDIIFEFIDDDSFKIKSLYVNDIETTDIIDIALLTDIFNDNIDENNYIEVSNNSNEHKLNNVIDNNSDISSHEISKEESVDVGNTVQRTKEEVIQTGLDILYDYYGSNIGYRFEYVSTDGIETVFKMFDDSKSEPYRGNLITNDNTRTFREDPSTVNEVRSYDEAVTEEISIGDGPVLYDIALDLLYKELNAPNANIEYISDKDFIFEFALLDDEGICIGTAIVDPQNEIVDILWENENIN